MAPRRGSPPTPRRHIGAEAAELATEQRGVVSWQQLRRLGYAEATVVQLVERGVLHRLWPGVYGYGHPVLTREGWLHAALLACGDGSHLMARSGASARGLMRAWSTIDVATPAHRGLTLPGIRAHRVVLRPEERDVHHGLAVTSLARTAVDVAALEGLERVSELLDEALLAGQYCHGEMTELLAARRGCRGVGVLRRAVAQLGDEGVVFRSRPERRARDLIRDAGLLVPSVNAWFTTRAGHGHELDLWWPRSRRNLEVDGPRHGLPYQRRKDALRDADLRAFGVEVVRVPDTLVTDEPLRFLAVVRDLVE